MEEDRDAREETKSSFETEHQILNSEPEQVGADLAIIPFIPSTTLQDIEDIDLSRQMSYTESVTTCRTSTQDGSSRTELSSATSTTGTAWALEPVIFQIQKFHVCATLPMDELLVAAWAEQILPRLNAELLHNIQIGTWLPELLLVGKKPDKLKPCVLITCGDNGTRKQVEKLYKRLKWLREVLKHREMMFLALTRKVVLSGGSRLQRPVYGATNSRCFIEISANTTTLCGQRVHIPMKESLSPSYCTLGGVIRIGDRLYGLMAGHPFAKDKEIKDNLDAEDESRIVSSTSASEASEDSDSPILFDENDPDSLSSALTADNFFESITPDVEDLPHTSLEGFRHEIWGQESEDLKRYHLQVVLPVSSSPHDPNVGEVVPDYDWALLEIEDMEIVLPNVNTTGSTEEHVVISDLAEQAPNQCPSQGNVTVLTATLGPIPAILNPAPASFKSGSCIFQVQLVVLDTNLREFQ